MKTFSKRVQELLAQMTPEEKIAQTFQGAVGHYHEEGVKLEDLTGPVVDQEISESMAWMVGSVINNSSCDAEKNRKVQETYIKNNRLGIPLLFMTDAIHAYRTVFPIPLALACTFDGKQAKDVAGAVAREARAAGTHVTFAPMLDLTRDPRWGRVTEGPGEDPYIGRVSARAWVEGFQGENGNGLRDGEHIASTLKHFAGYGFVDGGRDYDDTDISMRTFNNFVLPAFEEGVDAGAELVMSAFTSVDGIPAVVNKTLLKDTLRGKMGFDGVVISDYGSVPDAASYHLVDNAADAAKMAVDAGCDIDMMSFMYPNQLRGLLKDGKITMEQLDTMVGNILTLKENLGLFEDPYIGMSKEKTDELFLGERHREIARSTARESAVLLKNEGILPISKDTKTIAVIGPHANDHDLQGAWASFCWNGENVTLAEGIANAVPSAKLIIEEGCGFETADSALLEKAVAAARAADVVILALGEQTEWSGENRNRTDIALPAVQIELARAVTAENTNTVAVLYNGRPLALTELENTVPAILECWFMGTETGNATADLLFGDYEPTGRLAISFPRSVGQIPVYYNCPRISHGNESGGSEVPYVSRYLDNSIFPLYRFGHGLGYTAFEYSDVCVPETMRRGDAIEVSVTVTNTGERVGTETVQFYICDEVTQFVRPNKELKGAKKVTLHSGESEKVTFTIDESMLTYVHLDGERYADCGAFSVMIGHDSSVKDKKYFTLED